MENQDIDRTLGLLWRRSSATPQGIRGPKQRVSVDEVVRAAIAVADEEGLPAFSMRKVADRLGLKLMSIYTYVPGRAELIGLMVDEVIGEQRLPPHEGTLRERITAVARQIWDEYHRHPVAAAGRRTAARGSARTAPTATSGSSRRSRAPASPTWRWTRSSPWSAASPPGRPGPRSTPGRTAEQSGITDAEWWEINAPVLDRVMPPAPTRSPAGSARSAGQEYNAVGDPERSFRFGLDRILDGCRGPPRPLRRAPLAGPVVRLHVRLVEPNRWRRPLDRRRTAASEPGRVTSALRPVSSPGGRGHLQVVDQALVGGVPVVGAQHRRRVDRGQRLDLGAPGSPPGAGPTPATA